MWTVEVHDQCMEQAIEDEQALAKARKYGNSIPRHNCQGSSISVIGTCYFCSQRRSVSNSTMLSRFSEFVVIYSSPGECWPRHREPCKSGAKKSSRQNLQAGLG